MVFIREIPYGGLNETTYSRVRDLIREDILSGQLEPGVRLPIADLAKRYGVSQMPVREALQQLQGEGLVTLLPQKGASVRKIDERFVHNMYDIREAIESMLVRKSVDMAADRQIDEIEKYRQLHEQAVKSNDLPAILDYNIQFHFVINSIPDNPEALNIINRGWQIIDGFRKKFGFNPGRLEDIIRDHRNLVLAFKERDAGRAAEISTDHVRKAKADLISRMKMNLND